MSMRTADAGDYLATTRDVGPERGPDGLAAQGESFSLIDRFSTFDGTFRSDRDLRIEGEAKGTIECQGTLFVAQGANVTAKVEAQNITVAGDLSGDIRSRGRLQIMPSGRVRGKVATETLVINEGAFYEGQLEMASTGDHSTPRSLPTANAGAPAPLPAPTQPAERGPRPGEAGGQTNTFIRRFGGPETPWSSGSEGDDEDRPPHREG